MKINSINPSFKGVVLVGSVSKKQDGVFATLDQNIKFAEKIADTFEQKGEATFVVNNSDRDARGRSTERFNTYVLFGDEAKIVKKFDEIKVQMTKLFDNTGYSDSIDNHLGAKLSSLTNQQDKTAAFIAENRVEAEKKNFRY